VKQGILFGRPTALVFMRLSASRQLTFSAVAGSPSSSQAYTLVAKNLTEAPKLIAPAGFEISLNGLDWDDELVTAVDYYGPVYVRLNAAEAGTYAGNISHASAGAATMNLAVSGVAAEEHMVLLNPTTWLEYADDNKVLWSN
jgi:hypothetical protein